MTIKTMLVIALGALITFSANATNYYVATNDANASDSKDGKTLTTPFKTIQKAATVAKAGDVVYIRAGVYREKVTPTNSGSQTTPIVFQSYNNEEVIIKGTELITGWTQYSGNIYKAPMTGDFFTNTHNQSDQVFVNEKMYFLARWPNNTNMDPSHPQNAMMTTFVSKTVITGNKTEFKFTDTDLPAGVDMVGAEIYIQPNYEAWSWTFSGMVTAVNGTELTGWSYSTSGKDGGTGYDPKSRFFVHNKLSLLDAPGEWYHDKTNNLLYIWCENNANPSTLTVEAKKREFAFDLTNKSYITLKNLKVFCATITTDNESGGDNKGYDASGNVKYPWRNATYTAPATGNVLDGIHAKYISHYTDVSGHFFLQWGLSSGLIISGTNHTVRNCKIQFSAGNGIATQGKGHKIINNLIEDVNYMSTDMAGINTVQPGSTADVEMAYNTIRRTGRSGITPRSLINSDVNKSVARIHHNDISEYMIQDWDGGGIYSATNDQKFLRIDHNTFHDAAQGYIISGVYFDFSKNLIIDHNVIWNNDWPFHLQGYASDGKNNTLLYNNTAIISNKDKKSYGPFGVSNSSGTNEGTVIQNNILVFYDNGSATAPASMETIQKSGFSSATKTTNFLHENGNALFVDPANGDFRLKSGSPCIDAGTDIAPVTYDGTTINPFNDAIVNKIDIGAYEYDKPRFATGCKHDADELAPTAPTNLKAVKVLSDKLELNWDAATDNVGITAYYIYQGTTYVGYTENLVYAIKGLSASTQYSFSVKAVDYRGNVSDAVALSVSTVSADTQAPSKVTNITTSEVALTGFKLQWTAATDNQYVDKYEVMLNGSSKGYVMAPNTSMTIAGLSAKTAYKVTVKAYDGSNNVSTSDEVTVNTGDAALIVYDGFNYAVDALNADADGTASGFGYPASNYELTSTGLRGNWGSKSKVISGSLQYKDANNQYLATSANALAAENAAQSRKVYLYSGLTNDPFAGLRTTSTDFGAVNTEVWVSFLMQVTDVTKEARMVFKTVGNKSNFSVGIKDGKYCIIDSMLNVLGGVTATTNTTFLLVKATYGAQSTGRDDKIELWVNPDLTGTLPAPTSTYNGMVGDFGQFSTFTSLTSSDASMLTIDEVRAGLKISDVLPIGNAPNAVWSPEVERLTVYPTVCSTQVMVEANPGETIVLTDIAGKTMLNVKVVTNMTTLPLACCKPGLYFVTVRGEAVRTAKIVKK
jgi:chitodextrinase